jgi:hypothetical protein
MESFLSAKTERGPIASDISSLVQDSPRFSDEFEKEANFCAGSTQIHTHTATCLKYAIGRPAKDRNLCRFKAPWPLVPETSIDKDGVLHIRRGHPTVNRWNKAMAVGLRHNQDISFIGTQTRTFSIMYYVTNYATKSEDPVWKRVAVAAEIRRSVSGTIASDNAGGEPPNIADSTRINEEQFLLKVANRVFTERPLSQVEVQAELLNYPTEFSHSQVWTTLNVSALYWEIFRRWPYLSVASGQGVDTQDDDVVFLQKEGRWLSYIDAYPHRGETLQDVSLYDYMSIVKLKRKGKDDNSSNHIDLDQDWSMSDHWTQQIRKPGERAMVCLNGYLNSDFDEDNGECYKMSVEGSDHIRVVYATWKKLT